MVAEASEFVVKNEMQTMRKNRLKFPIKTFSLAAKKRICNETNI